MQKLVKNNNINSSFKYHITEIDNKWSDILNNINFLPYKKNIILKILNSSTTKKYGIILKLCKYDLYDDYDFNTKLIDIHGFIKYVCYIKNNKDFLSLLYNNSNINYDNYDIIIMPYYHYNISNYKWCCIIDIINCLKQIILSSYKAYFEKNILLVDLNIYNILLDINNKKKTIVYNVFNTDFYIEKNLIDIKIVDFDNCKYITDIHNKSNYIFFYNGIVDVLKYFEKYYNILNIINYINDNINDNSIDPYNILINIIKMLDNIS